MSLNEISLKAEKYSDVHYNQSWKVMEMNKLHIYKLVLGLSSHCFELCSDVKEISHPAKGLRI